jgi:hypothetical protein
MSNDQEERQQAQGVQKLVSIKEEPYYANCTMVETTPFDISVLLGRVRPRTDDKGNRSLVEVYDKQVYFSHLQARALHEALGRAIATLGGQPRIVGPRPPQEG